MKKIFLVLFLLSSSVYCYAGLFGISAELFSKKTTEIAADLSLIKNMNFTANTDIAGIKSSIGQLNTKIGNINTELSAKIVGLDNSVSTKVQARDITTEIYNDPEILKYIIVGLVGIIMFLLRDATATRKWLQNALKSKEEYKRNSGGVR